MPKTFEFVLALAKNFNLFLKAMSKHEVSSSPIDLPAQTERLLEVVDYNLEIELSIDF